MNIVDALNINICNREVISIVGAGGKTSTMYRIAWELKKKKKRVLITTTTAIYCPPSYIYDDLFISNKIEELCKKSNDVLDSSITVIGSYIINNKLKGINKNWINILYDKFDYIIVEADGAKRKPIKAPASYEPVIPSLTTKVIGCIGLDCIGSYINDKYVHRADIFSKVVNQRLDSTINYDTIRHLINSKDGLFKECGNINNKIVLFNKAYTDNLLQEARIASEIILQENKSISKVIIGNVQNNNPILIVME